MEEFRYPRADMPNAVSTLRLVRFSLAPGSQEVTDIVHYDLITSLQTLFPWHEYVVRVGWTEDGTQVWAQLLDRSQQRLELVLIPESQFERSSLPRLGSSLDSPASSNGPGSPLDGLAPAPVQVRLLTSHWLRVIMLP